MSRGGGGLLKMVFAWWNIASRARMAKQCVPEERQKIVRFGVYAVINAFLTAACACALLLLLDPFSYGLVLGILALIVGVAVGIVGTLNCLVTTLIYWFCQLSINRRAGTWITLVFVLIGLAGAVLIPFMILM